MLPLAQLLVDPAVIVFVLLHVAALAAPWWAGGLTWSAAGAVCASYTARMFGEQPRFVLAPFSHQLRHYRRLPPPAVAPVLPDYASAAGARAEQSRGP